MAASGRFGALRFNCISESTEDKGLVMRISMRRKRSGSESIILILFLSVILVAAISVALIPGYLTSLGMTLEDIRNTMSRIGLVASVVVVIMGTILIAYWQVAPHNPLIGASSMASYCIGNEK